MNSEERGSIRWDIKMTTHVPSRRFVLSKRTPPPTHHHHHYHYHYYYPRKTEKFSFDSGLFEPSQEKEEKVQQELASDKSHRRRSLYMHIFIYYIPFKHLYWSLETREKKQIDASIETN